MASPNRPFSNSFDISWFGPNAMSTLPDIYLDSPLNSVIVWTPALTYFWWSLSFNYANPIGEILCIQVVLRPNDQIHTRVPFGSPAERSQSQGLTTVQFRGATDLYSTAQSVPIFRATIAGSSMRQILWSMNNNIPGYRLRSGSLGSPGWTFLVLRSLARDGHISPETNAQFDATAERLHNFSPTMARNVPYPPIYGTPVIN